MRMPLGISGRIVSVFLSLFFGCGRSSDLVMDEVISRE